MKKFKVLILGNETEDDDFLWVKACEQNNQIEYQVIDLTMNNWLDEIHKQDFDYLLTKPGGLTSPFKQLYDERVYILSSVLKYNLFPSAEEIFIYENKRFLSFWLKANKIPHPKTDVFYNMNEAIKFINNIDGQIVAKTNIGASGSGVRILKTSTQKLDYIKSTFAGKGAPQRSGPNLGKGGVLKRGFKYILHPKGISKKLKTYRVLNQNKQKGFVIFQEYIPHEFEWRVVRIGDSYFAHKKLKLGDKASGTLIKRYDSPPLMLLDFVKELTDKYKFYSLAVDIFEYNGKYLVNEMQCIFGQSDAYQMKVDGKIGRYFHENNNWVFEEGDFCENECFNLRIKFIENILDNS